MSKKKSRFVIRLPRGIVQILFYGMNSSLNFHPRRLHPSLEGISFWLVCPVVFLVVGLSAIAIPMHAEATQKIGQMNFEQNFDDPYGILVGDGQYGEFVPGHTGYAFRSSHAGDDGSGTDDYCIGFPDGNYWPDSNELYIKFYYKFEPEYANISSNVKWFWTLGSDAHNEIICSSVSSAAVNLRWQLSGGDSGWSSGITKYGGVSVVQGTWMKVEIYFKLSSGSTNLNADGVQWIKINDENVISQTNVRTGKPGRMSCPAINATCNQPPGHGWWQIDDYEIWDGIPTSGSDTTPPSRSNPQPTGTLTSGTTSTTISLDTDETAICKYSRIIGTNYDLMTLQLSSGQANSHTATISDLEDGNSYTYYIRCQDESNNQNTDDFTISFSIASSTTYSISNSINLVTDWLKSESGLESDVNGDGVVNTRDLGIMMSNWQ